MKKLILYFILTFTNFAIANENQLIGLDVNYRNENAHQVIAKVKAQNGRNIIVEYNSSSRWNKNDFLKNVNFFVPRYIDNAYWPFKEDSIELERYELIATNAYPSEGDRGATFIIIEGKYYVMQGHGNGWCEGGLDSQSSETSGMKNPKCYRFDGKKLYKEDYSAYKKHMTQYRKDFESLFLPCKGNKKEKAECLDMPTRPKKR